MIVRPSVAELAVVVGLASAVGGIVALIASRALAGWSPTSLVRTNLRGREVPAILGIAVALGGFVGLAVAALASGAVGDFLGESDLAPGAVVILGALAAAGLWDDLKGDERPRGFSGHLGALKGGRLTGGLVKLLVGGLAGLLAGAIVTTGAARIVTTGAIVALGANLVNLLDRAPGRAAKGVLLLVPAALAAGGWTWALVAAGSLGALVFVLPADLSARGMLGDAGANPLGGLIGLGLAAGPGLADVVVLAGLGAANLASERWSFSAAIERVGWLRRFDLWGRKDV